MWGEAAPGLGFLSCYFVWSVAHPMGFPPGVWVGSAPLDEPLDELVLPTIPTQFFQLSGQQSFYFYFSLAQSFSCEWNSGHTAFNRLEVRGAGKGCSGRDIDISGCQCLSALRWPICLRCFGEWAIAEEPLVAQTEGWQRFSDRSIFQPQMLKRSYCQSRERVLLLMGETRHRGTNGFFF